MFPMKAAKLIKAMVVVKNIEIAYVQDARSLDSMTVALSKIMAQIRIQCLVFLNNLQIKCAKLNL